MQFQIEELKQRLSDLSKRLEILEKQQEVIKLFDNDNIVREIDSSTMNSGKTLTQEQILSQFKYK